MGYDQREAIFDAGLWDRSSRSAKGLPVASAGKAATLKFDEVPEIDPDILKDTTSMCMPTKKTLGDVLIAIERFQEATQAPCARCPDGAKRWHDRIDARKTDLLDTIQAYEAAK